LYALIHPQDGLGFSRQAVLPCAHVMDGKACQVCGKLFRVGRSVCITTKFSPCY